MIRVASLPVRKDHHARALLPDNLRNFQPVLKSVLNPPIRNVEGLTPGDAQYLRGILRFPCALLRRASRSHLSLSKIENSGTPSALRHFQQRAAAGLFDVVAVRSDRQNIKGRSGTGKSRHPSRGSPVPEPRFPARSNDAPPSPSMLAEHGS